MVPRFLLRTYITVAVLLKGFIYPTPQTQTLPIVIKTVLKEIYNALWLQPWKTILLI